MLRLFSNFWKVCSQLEILFPLVLGEDKVWLPEKILLPFLSDGDGDGILDDSDELWWRWLKTVEGGWCYSDFGFISFFMGFFLYDTGFVIVTH